MSLAATTCLKCGTNNINSARFCGSCGQPVAAAAVPTGNPGPQANPFQNNGFQNNAFPNNAFPNQAFPAKPAADSNWQEMAGLVCGVLSMFVLGIFSAVPGAYFSWVAIGKAKAAGKSTRLGVIGMILNGLGILATFALIVLLIMLFAFQASAMGGGYDSGYYAPNPYGY